MIPQFKRNFKISCILASLFILNSCGIARVYKEPAEGPRARIRVIHGGAGAYFYPGDTCFNSGNPRSGFAYQIFGDMRSNKLLDMPLQPEKGAFNEFYVNAGEPIAVSFYFRTEEMLHGPSKKKVTTCGPIGFSFTPQPGEDYEARFFFASRNFCSYSFHKIAPDAAGGYRPELMRFQQASSCDKDKSGGSPSSTGTPSQVLPEIEATRTYYY